MNLTKLKRYWPFLFLICLSLIPLLWFKNNMIIAGGDNTIYLNPSVLIKNYSYSWINVLNLGNSNMSVCHIFPYGFFWYLLEKLSLSNIVIEKLWFISIWFVGSFSIFKLASYVTKSLKYYSLAGVIAAILYQCNTYKMTDILTVPKHLTYMVLPLLLYLFIKGVNSKKNIYVAYFSLSTLLFASAWVNPAAAVVAYFPIIFYFIYHVIIHWSNHKEIRGDFLFLAKILLASLLINLWWIIPFYFNLVETATDIKSTIVLTGYPKETILFEIFRFMGNWAFRIESYQMPYYPYYPLYYNTLLVFLSYLIPIISLFSLFFYRKLNKRVFYFYFLFIVGVFLAGGRSTFMAFYFNFLCKHLPGFWIFRSPYAKFTPLNTLSLSVLFAVTVTFIFRYFDRLNIRQIKRRVYKSTIFIASIIVILVVAFPLLTGDCVWHYWNGPTRSHHADIPNYWFRAGRWFTDKFPHCRIFVTPKGGYGQPFNWNSGADTSIEGVVMFFLPNPYCTYDPFSFSYSQKIINNIYDNLSSLENRMVNILRILGIKFILQQNDLDWEFSHENTYSPARMRKILKSQDGLYLKKTIGQLDIYKISDEYLLPQIYSSVNPVAANKDISSLIALAKTEYLKNEPAIFFTKQAPNEKLYKKINIPQLLFSDNAWHLVSRDLHDTYYSEKPKLSFKRINPTKYIIKIKQAKGPFWLIFSENYHKLWKIYKMRKRESGILGNNLVENYSNAYVREYEHLMRLAPRDIRYIFKEPADTLHYAVNGYANSWYIDPKRFGGENFMLVIYFLPQSYTYIGFIISAIILLWCILYLFYNVTIRRKQCRDLKG